MLTTKHVINDVLAALKPALCEKQRTATEKLPVVTMQEEDVYKDMPSEYGSFDAIKTTLDLLKMLSAKSAMSTAIPTLKTRTVSAR